MTEIIFVDCAGDPAHRPHDHAAPRREVRLNGRRLRVVDVHAHCAFPAAMAMAGQAYPAGANPGLPQVLRVAEDQIPVRLAAMDAQGIDLEVLSINPYWYGAEADLAREICQVQNEGLADVVARHGDR